MSSRVSGGVSGHGRFGVVVALALAAVVAIAVMAPAALAGKPMGTCS
jgi:hypothetical protein